MTERSPADGPDAEVATLLERRATLERWLARLDDVGPEVSPRVAERVRGDYQARLREIAGLLASREDAVRAELESRSADLARAEEEHAAALDTLEEHLLRQRIGEIPTEAWEERRPGLEHAAAEARERLESLRAETARLQSVLAEIVAPSAAAPPSGTPAPATEADGAAGAVTDREPAVAEDAAARPPGPGDLAFLEELDRALTLPPVAGRAGPDPDPGARVAPRRGAKCPECGYTNDVGAWYCGVCGVDLA